MRSESSSSSLLALPLLLLLLIAGLGPIGSAIYNGFFHDFYGERSFAGFANYASILRDEGFAFSGRITVGWAVLSTALSLGVGLLGALALQRSSKRSALLYIALLVPWGIPVTILVPMWRVLIHSILGINLLTRAMPAFFATVLVSVWVSSPVCCFVFLATLRRVPVHLGEAAALEGASPGVVAYSIYLPQLRETVLAMGLLTFIKSLKEFVVIHLLTAGGPPLPSGFSGRAIVGATTTLDIYLFDLFQNTHDFGIPSAFSTLMIGIVCLVMMVWAVLRSKKPRRVTVVVLVALVQAAFGGPVGLIFGLVFLVSLRWPRLFVRVVAAQIVVAVTRLAALGFLESFNPGIVVSTLGFLVLRRAEDPGREFRPRQVAASLVSVLRTVVSILVVLSSAVMLWQVIALSLSPVDALSLRSLITNSKYSGTKHDNTSVETVYILPYMKPPAKSG